MGKKVDYKKLFELARHDLELYLHIIEEFEELAEPFGFKPDKKSPEDVFHFIKLLIEGKV